MKKTVKFAIIGCGRISKKHIELFIKKRITKGILVGICDTNIDKAKKYSLLYKIPFFKKADQLIINTNPDVIVILTESGNHAKHVIKLSKFKKHIIVEKPMALKVKDAQAMISSCKKNKINGYELNSTY